MDVNEALEFIDNQIFQFKDRHLNDLQRVIIKGAWNNLTYKLIAFKSSYGTGYIAEIAYNSMPIMC